MLHRWHLVLLLLAAVGLQAAEPTHSFTQTLTPEQRRSLGLADLSDAQLAELDAAVNAYAHGQTSVAVDEVRKESDEKVKAAQQKAAEEAVAEYKKHKEPGVIAKTLAAFKHKQEEDRRERFTAHVVGEFRGWSGGTYFPLDNGQIWRQVTPDNNELPPVRDAVVEIYKSANGYWRLSYEGAWITVKRLQ